MHPAHTDIHITTMTIHRVVDLPMLRSLDLSADRSVDLSRYSQLHVRIRYACMCMCPCTCTCSVRVAPLGRSAVSAPHLLVSLRSEAFADYRGAGRRLLDSFCSRVTSPQAGPSDHLERRPGPLRRSRRPKCPEPQKCDARWDLLSHVGPVRRLPERCDRV